MVALNDFFSQIDKNQSAYIERLAQAVEIPSVSGDATYRKYVFEMGDWLKAELEKLGATTEFKPLGMQTLDGQEVELPPVIFADYKAKTDSDKKKTILVYGVSERRKHEWYAARSFTSLSMLCSTLMCSQHSSPTAGIASRSSW